MKKVFATIVFALSVSIIHAQHTISGLISDSKDDALLLSGVKVYVPEFDRFDESKEGGTYLLKNVGIGVVHVLFAKEGYRSVVRVVDTKDSATVVNLDMVKDPGPVATITSVGPFPTIPSQSPFAITQLDGRKLSRMGQPKLLTSIAYEPGIDVVTIGQISRPVIRGLSGGHVLMIQSGSRILSNQLDQRYDYEMIDNGTSEVEILKGPAALIYGDNAMGGVMIFKDETMPPPGKVVGDVGLGFNSNTVGLRGDVGVKGTTNSGVFYSFRTGGASHTSYIQGEGFDQKKNTEQKNFAYNSGWVAGDVKGIIGMTGKWGQSRVSVTYWKKQHELIQSFSESETDTMDQDPQRDRESSHPFLGQQSVLVSMLNGIFLGKAKLDVNASWQSYQRESSYKTSAFNFDVRYTSDATKKIGYSIGSQGYFQNKDYTAYYSISENKVLSNSIYALFRYDLEKLNFLAGARYDMKKLTTPNESLDEDFNFINGSVGAAYRPVEELTIKLNGASGNSVPDEERYYFNRLYYGFLYSTHIRKETNYQVDLGVEWRHRLLTIMAEGFYNEVQDYTFPVYIRSSNDQFFLTQEDTRFVGGEFKAVVHPPSLEWVNVSVGFSTVDNERIDDVPQIPGSKISSGLRFQSKKMGYMYNGYIEVLMRNYLEQHPYDPYKGYTLVDFHLGGSFHWGMQTFDITLAINNILDEKYFNHLSLAYYNSPVSVMDMGRNVAVMVRLPFGL